MNNIPGIHETITARELLILAEHSGKLYLLKRLRAVDPNKVFSSDGCSMWFDKWKGKDMYPSCFWHDVDYWLGGTEYERLMADIYLTISVATATGDTEMARTMFLGVSAGGADTFLNLPYEWGYGNE